LRFNGRYLLWIVVAGLTLLLFFGPWHGEKNGYKGLGLGHIGGYEADLTVEGLRYTRNVGDQVQWMLEADTASLYENKKIMYLKGVKIDFFQKNGKKVVSTADSGNYKIDNDLALAGNVVVDLPNGQVLNSNTLNLNQKKGLIWTKDKVLIKGNGLVMKGSGLEYDLRAGTLKVRSQTSVISSHGSMEL
jgi:LPS export ABC transporter protein LptC